MVTPNRLFPESFFRGSFGVNSTMGGAGGNEMRQAVPFVPVMRGSKNHAQQAADQLNVLIQQMHEQRWRFVRLESVTSVEPAGCFSWGQEKVFTVQVAVFEREPAVESSTHHSAYAST